MTQPIPVVPAVIPPPPPPPPPLPPISLSSSSRSTSGFGRLRSVFWERIPRERVEGRRSIWTKSDEFLIDFTSLDELFGQCQGRQVKEPRVRRQHGQDKHINTNTPRRNTLDKISILESNRSLQVGIFLHHFKSTLGEIINDIREGRGQRYGSEKLNELYKLLPDSDEEQLLRAFRGERSQLDEVDLFLLHLVEIPSFRLRLEAMILQEDFDSAVTSVSTSARCLVTAATELMGCVELHFILRLVLKAGNYMNAGGFAGNAAGFRISSLLRLADTKANRPGMNLLHFVAMEAVKKDPSILSYHLKLSHVGPAARLSVEVVQEEFNELQRRVTTLQERVRTTSDLHTQIAPFLQSAELKLSELQLDVDCLFKAQHSLLEFFCEEDDGSFKLEEACATFHSFQQRFLRAAQENVLREQQYRRRLEREEMERERAGKRRSIASCSALEAGLECDNDTLEMILGAPVTSSRRRSLWSTLGRQTLQRKALFSLTETLAEKTNLTGSEAGKRNDFPDSGDVDPIRTETQPDTKLTSMSCPPLRSGSANRFAQSAIPSQSQTPGSILRPQVAETHTLVPALQSYSSLAPACVEEEREGRKQAVEEKSVEIRKQQKARNMVSSEVDGKKTGSLKERTMKDVRPANRNKNTSPLKDSRLPLLRNGFRTATPPSPDQSGTEVRTLKEERPIRREQKAKIPQPLKRLLDRASSSKKEREKKESGNEVKEKPITENDKERQRREKEKKKNEREREKQQEKERQKKVREKGKKEREKESVKSEKERERARMEGVKEGSIERSARPGSALALAVSRPLSRLCPGAAPLALALHSVLKRDRNSSSRIPTPTSRATHSLPR
ncbi:uncharacterized protein [Salminus brasiliensis]|uniref:uncharacterized protein n=1 Tax=Salminus brasiliensis TaxID=930266 RepID=UPI003B830DC2